MDWIKGKLMGWKKKMLSFASRRVLIRVCCSSYSNLFDNSTKNMILYGVSFLLKDVGKTTKNL
jgi:hypothetical protein